MTIKRRDFLRMGSFITVSAASMSLTGCDLFDDDDDSPSAAPLPAEASGDYWFPQSIVSADPKPDSIILWTRTVAGLKPAAPTLIDVTAVATGNVSVRLQVSDTAANAANVGSNAVLSDSTVANVLVPALAQFDGTVRHKLTGLQPGKTYYYQFVAGTGRTNIGQFKTAPASNSADTVKFAFMSCQDWNSNHWAAYSDLASNSADLGFMVHLGDYIYETAKFSPSATESRHGELTLPGVYEIVEIEQVTGTTTTVTTVLHDKREPLTVPGTVLSRTPVAAQPEDYRYLYKAYRSDLRIQAVHERLAMVAVWDDHEFSDDCWQNAETYTNLNTLQTARRRAANQSWYEFMPADISFSANDPSFQNVKIYRDLKFGQTVHLVMTDERLYKSDHLIPETTTKPGTGGTTGVPAQQLGRINSRYLAPETGLKSAELQKSGLGASMTGGDPLRLISILGKEQRDWWKSTMQGSTAAWKIWGNEVSLLRMGLNGTDAVGTLIALQILKDTPTTMNSALGLASVQALPKVAAGAGAAIQNGATPQVAIPATFAILQKFAATGSQAEAVTAGVQAGLTEQQAGAALTAIGGKTPTAAEIGICAPAVVAGTTLYMTTGTLQANASNAAAGAVVGMLLQDAFANNNASDANLLTAAKGGVLSDPVASILVNVYKAAKAQAANGQTAQVGAGAQAFLANSSNLLDLIRNEVATNKTNSSFVLASGQAPLLTAFLQKFLINADQWDGYGAERKNLMSFLNDSGIKNVVAITGDIHAFFAGEVYANYPGEVLSLNANGTEATASAGDAKAAMVDLVTAGVSSSSWFTYLSEAAAQLSQLLVTLVSFTVTKAQSGLPVDVVLPVLDFTMGKPFSTQALTLMASDAFKKALAAAGIPELAFTAGFNQANNTSLTPAQAIGAVAGQLAGNASLQSLCGALAALNGNPWLKHIDTDAQGYAVVTASSSNLSCTFKRTNNLFVIGGNGMAPGLFPGVPELPAPDNRPVVAREVAVTVALDSASVTLVP